MSQALAQSRKGTMRVCAGGLLVRGNEILLAKRSADREFYPGVWDVVGGHCEGNETPTAALIRELEEEIGVRAVAFEEIATLEEPRPVEHGEAKYHIFAVIAWTGEPRLQSTEHSELGWLSLDQALVLPLAHPRYAQLFRAVLEGRESAPRKEMRDAGHA